MKNKIEKTSKSVTTLLLLYILLSDAIKCMQNGTDPDGLTSAGISSIYNETAKVFSISKKYYETYLQRHSGDDSFFIKTGDRYFLRKTFTEGVSIDELLDNVRRIEELLREINAFYNTFFSELENVKASGNVETAYTYIQELFSEKRFRNFGQVFEILSYSILSVYFRSFGFSLKRFSVSYANDGGMDFLSTEGIYQVTSSPGSKKIADDLSKSPGISRVLVINGNSDKIRRICDESGLVTQIITSEDLKSHFLDFMYQRSIKGADFVGQIIQTIDKEMKREAV